MFTAGKSSFFSNIALVIENFRLERTSESSSPAFCPEAITEGDNSSSKLNLGQVPLASASLKGHEKK